MTPLDINHVAPSLYHSNIPVVAHEERLECLIFIRHLVLSNLSDVVGGVSLYIERRRPVCMPLLYRSA